RSCCEVRTLSEVGRSAVRVAEDGAPQLFIQRVPGTGRRTDVTPTLSLTVVLWWIFRVFGIVIWRWLGRAKRGFRGQIVNGEIDRAEVIRQLAHCGLKHTGAINPKVIAWRLLQLLIGRNTGRQMDLLQPAAIECSLIDDVPMRCEPRRSSDNVAEAGVDPTWRHGLVSILINVGNVTGIARLQRGHHAVANRVAR